MAEAAQVTTASRGWPSSRRAPPSNSVSRRGRSSRAGGAATVEAALGWVSTRITATTSAEASTASGREHGSGEEQGADQRAEELVADDLGADQPAVGPLQLGLLHQPGEHAVARGVPEGLRRPEDEGRRGEQRNRHGLGEDQEEQGAEDASARGRGGPGQEGAAPPGKGGPRASHPRTGRRVHGSARPEAYPHHPVERGAARVRKGRDTDPEGGRAVWEWPSAR